MKSSVWWRQANFMKIAPSCGPSKPRTSTSCWCTGQHHTIAVLELRRVGHTRTGINPRWAAAATPCRPPGDEALRTVCPSRNRLGAVVGDVNSTAACSLVAPNWASASPTWRRACAAATAAPEEVNRLVTMLSDLLLTTCDGRTATCWRRVYPLGIGRSAIQ